MTIFSPTFANTQCVCTSRATAGVTIAFFQVARSSRSEMCACVRGWRMHIIVSNFEESTASRRHVVRQVLDRAAGKNEHTVPFNLAHAHITHLELMDTWNN